MLKIIFSGEDVLRTRVAPAADPLWELVLSLHLLQGRSRDPMMTTWRRTVAHGLRTDTDAEQYRLLLALNPPRGYFPDFLTPSASREGIEAGLDAVRGTPVDMLRRDLTRLAGETALPSSAGALARGEPATLHHLTDAMARYQSLAVTPYWARVQAAVEADRARRARAMLDGGAEGLLASLRPNMRWVSGVLEVLDYPDTRELHLDGRGLLLVPSFFCSRTPVALVDPTLPPVLVYPVDRLAGLTPASGPAASPQGEALAALLGRTRSRVLQAADEGCTTGEMARRLRISAAAASQHTTVLRNAGLLVSQRDRNTVLHTLTPLGRAVLDA
ncbi:MULTISPECIES: ArsR/SmtB family transcription factor [Micromonospora]|uniref:Transcriptional regulator n=1 Tax=Micromonospora tulbaghiae TaxID=479978 RepID=A0A386WQJ7_9ACTN|nr:MULTISPECIES: winged helix-turn-helix domain-containing protein [Micromonospora]AYF29660.1 transcriptional regulator [Micromonospora tulbaghiae]MCO1615759.1 winged helix-turn-helix domain-containing protein [Micromonospora sp. CPM1]NED53125.1 winged helix-turn-helix transcriptional regulator [Micromonospora aurantiaca]RLQ07283.1 ArsR family transcriptional regulator [Micromonospora sp. BL1]